MKGFKVTVQGLYIARSGVMDKERIVKDYELEANIPTMKCALSIVKNKILDPILKVKYKDYVSYYTYHITQYVPLDEESAKEVAKVEITYMNREALLAYITEHALPVEAHLYPDLFKLREAVQFAKNDTKGYLKKLELRRPDLEMDQEIARLNPTVFSESQQNPTTVGISVGATKKDTSEKKIDKQAQQRTDSVEKEMFKTGELGPLDKTNTPKDESADL